MDKKINLATLHHEIEWLQQVVDQVIRTYLVQEGSDNSWTDLPLPDLSGNESIFAQTVRKHNLTVYDRLALALALAPSLKPEALDIFFAKNQMYDRRFSSFGGVHHSAHCGFLPTAQTFCFLLTATDQSLRLEVMNTLSEDHSLIKEKIIIVGKTDPFIPPFNGLLGINQNWLQYFITGEPINL